MKKILYLITALCLFGTGNALAQCNLSCNPNSGLNSTDDATTIMYDNIVVAYHATCVRKSNGDFEVWGGENLQEAGVNNLLAPTTIDATNYPLLTGTVYKVALGAKKITVAPNPGAYAQMIVLTSDGLFVVGSEGAVLSNSLTSSNAFEKLNINGQADGLPPGIDPKDVKMLFASTDTLILTTCNGEVYVISQNVNVRGNGGTGSDTAWYRVMQTPATPLKNVIAARGSAYVGFALKSDGTLWTWGRNTYLGNNSGATNRNYATKMQTLPGNPKIKMIQATNDSGAPAPDQVSYYVLGTNKRVYSLGANRFGQLGDRSHSTRKGWVNARRPGNNVITDAAWISGNEHSREFPGLAVIRSGGLLYAAGQNDYYMVGRAINGANNPPPTPINHLDFPNGINANHVIKQCETGGHMSIVIKEGSPRYGFVGHKVNGSVGNNTGTEQTIGTYNFQLPPLIDVCDVRCIAPVLSSNSPVCKEQNAVFTITGTPGNLVNYQLNGGSVQTITIGPGGTAIITVPSVVTDQTLNLTYVSSPIKDCSNSLTTTATVVVKETTDPTFDIPDLCSDDLPYVLPTTSIEGIHGVWIPSVIDHIGSTEPKFYPNEGECARSVSIEIVVHESITPAFSFPTILCAESPFPELGTHPDNYELPGHWEHDGNVVTEITDAGDYYFYLDTVSGPCVVNPTLVTITITNTVIIPTFDGLSSPMTLCEGELPPPLPSISEEGVPGTWNAHFIDTTKEGTTIYCFTPLKGYCADRVCFEIRIIKPITPIFSFPTVICEGGEFPRLPDHPDNSTETGHWTPDFTGPGTYCFTFDSISGPCIGSTCVTLYQTPELIVPTFGEFPQIAAICERSTSPPQLPTVSLEGVSGYWTPSATIDTSVAGIFTYCFNPYEGNCADKVCFDIRIGCGTPEMPRVHCFGFDPTYLAPDENRAFIDFGIWPPAPFGITFTWYFRFHDHTLLTLYGENPTFEANCKEKKVMAFGLVVTNGVSVQKFYAPPASGFYSYYIPGFGGAASPTCFHHPACIDEEGGGYKAVSEAESIIIAPNPTKSTIAFTGTELGKYTIVLYDLLGKELLHRTGLDSEINMEKLASGVYLYKISKDGTVTQSGKIIKE